MHPRILSTIVLLVAGPIVFGVGAISAIRGGWANASVVVEVANQSGSPALLVEVELTTCGVTRNIQQKLLASSAFNTKREAIQFQVMVCGEASHITRVTLANGKILESPGNSYLQPGTTITNYIHNDRVAITRPPENLEVS